MACTAHGGLLFLVQEGDALTHVTTVARTPRVASYRLGMGLRVSWPSETGYTRDVSLEQLETVVAIAEEGALVRAARRLHISQPPLTRKLRALEEELGTELFERRASGMTPTPAGRLFVERARAILASVEDARRVVAPGPAPRVG